MHIEQQVERIENFDPAEFTERFAIPGKPVVLAGAIRHWPATRRWTPEYLKELLGDTEITYRRSTNGVHPNFREPTLAQALAVDRSSFREYIDAITLGPPEERMRRLFHGEDDEFLLRRRNGKTAINERLRPLLDDIALTDFVPEERLYTAWVWFSSSGVRTWLHYDNNGCHDFNAQITGRKRCLLFSPEQVAKLAPFPLGGEVPVYNCSQIDVNEPDLEMFPGFADVPCLEATVEAGDLLFLPAWWFHWFVHLGELNINVNFWWRPERPIMNPIAARQVLIDAVAAAKIDSTSDPSISMLLQRLDRATVERS